MENIKNEITLTASQRAKKKYYEKIKNDPNYIARRRINSLNYYHNNLKYNEDYNKRISEQKKEYYIRTRKEFLLLDIIV